MSAQAPLRPVAVLFIEAAAGFGGSVVALGRLLDALDRSRFRAHVAVADEAQARYLRSAAAPAESLRVLRRWRRPRPPAGGPPGAAAAEASLRAAARLAATPLRAASYYWNIVRPAAAEIEAIVAETRAALVHANNGVSANLPAIAAAWHAGVPCVVKQRGFQERTAEVRWWCRRVAGFLPASRAVADDLRRAGVPGPKIVVNHSPIDLRRFACDDAVRDVARREFGFGPDAHVVGISACLVPWKGHATFLDAAARIAHADPRARFLVVGDVADAADRPWAAGLRERAAALGIAGRVVFAGHRDDVPACVAAMDVCVHASTEPEPFGMAVAEAMAAARAVVAARAGGPAEFVEDGENGLLTPPGDAASLAEAVLALLRDESLRRRLAEAGRRTARARFDPASHAAATALVYDAALAGVAPAAGDV